MLILIDNYDSFTYNLYQSISLFEHKVKIFRNDQITIDEIETLNPTGIILSPGPGRPEDAGILIPLIKYFFDKVPILGICLGHQAIGAAFGATISSAKKIMHGKGSTIYHHQQGIYKKLSNPFIAARYHSLAIEKNTLNHELLIDSVSEDGTIMGISHRKYPCIGLQFHPESILTTEGNKLIFEFIQLCQYVKSPI